MRVQGFLFLSVGLSYIAVTVGIVRFSVALSVDIHIRGAFAAFGGFCCFWCFLLFLVILCFCGLLLHLRSVKAVPGLLVSAIAYSLLNSVVRFDFGGQLPRG